MDRVITKRLKIAMLVVGFLGGSATYAWHIDKALQDAPLNAVWSTYRRVDWWILSARCTQLRKVFLVACGEHGELYPIEDVSPTDDRGHGLLANLVALFQSKPFDKTDMVRINVWVNAVGIGLLALVFILCDMPWAGFLCLIAGSQYGIPGPMASADAQATFFGEYCLILTPVPWIAQLSMRGRATVRFHMAGILGLFSLIAAILLREAIGLIGIASAVLLLLVSFVNARQKSWKVFRDYSMFIVLAILTLFANTTMLSVRNYVLKLPAARLIESHGIAHAFHQGLGTEPNPWGIQYGDLNGAQAALQANSRALYGTPTYYREMRRLFVDIVRRHPYQVTIIYAKKLKKILSLPLRFGGVSIFWYAVGVVIGLGFLPKSSTGPSVSLRAAFGAGMTLGAFLAQGVLVLPSPVFLYPAKFGVLLLLILMVDEGMRRLWLEPDR